MRITKIINLLNERIKNNSNKEYRIGIEFLQKGIDRYEKQIYFYDAWNLDETINYEVLINKEMNKQYIKLMDPSLNNHFDFLIEDKDYEVDEVLSRNLDLSFDTWLVFEIYCSESDIFNAFSKMKVESGFTSKHINDLDLTYPNFQLMVFSSIPIKIGETTNIEFNYGNFNEYDFLEE
ncbi:hypothetical protein [Clostridium sp. JS66]|uniref:hypothetical protein n=1 Tax=Clostridium sp. JS66 TaxID=3064705 RepID=UPI00298E7AF7|nr:hypothetical protein [Clostridium sp. JS66]WPC42371.1 hypothetical protein Q6H37_02595 [Clostridium sp. JS66]